MDEGTALAYRIFPQLAGTRWRHVDLNDVATDLGRLLGPMLEQDQNPFLVPDVMDEWMHFLHKVMGVDYTYGGWLEDRAVLWAGHYHKPGETVHLGVDFNVEAGQDVHMPVGGILVHAENDGDQDGGWGGKVIFKCEGKEEPFYLIFGHLKNFVTDIGGIYPPGSKIGVVAESDKNGGWGEHTARSVLQKSSSRAWTVMRLG
jgi:hypothetical protein